MSESTSRAFEPAGFATLRERFPWPDQPRFSDLRPVGRRIQGYEMFEEAIRSTGNPNPVVMEVGAEFGGSTRRALSIDGSFVVSVDPWPDDYRYGSFPDLAHLRGVENAMYEVFQSLNFEFRDRLVAVRAFSPEGPKAVYDAGVRPDLVYLDGDHRFEPVLRDLTIVTTLFPDAIVGGDDWNYNLKGRRFEGIAYPVRVAVKRWAQSNDVAIRIDKNTWMLDPSRPFNLDPTPPVVGRALIDPRLDKRLRAIEDRQREIAHALTLPTARGVVNRIRLLTGAASSRSRETGR